MSTATHGYSNIKMFGRPNYNTIHNLGSSKTGQNVIQKSLAEVTAIPQSIVSVTPRNNGQEFIIEITGHGAKIGDICRFYTGAATHSEYDIVEIVDANNFVIHNTGITPVATDTAKVMYYVTSKSDAEGNVNFSPGPTQFIQNGSSVQVTQDTATPANNKPLPAGIYIIKDGVIVPVLKDTGTPANTVGIPVELVAASGSPINLTAGDINVQLSHLGVNFDSTRIGDGANLLIVNADGSINVNDAATLAKLTSLDGKDFATGAKQDLAKTVLDNILTALGSQSTGAKQDLAKTVLDNILTALGLQATAAKQDLAKTVLDNILTALGSQATAAKQDLAKTVLDSILTALGSQATAAKQDLAKTVLDNILTALGSQATAAKQDLAKTVLDNIKTNTDTRVINSVTNIATSNATIAAPANAKGFIIQNSTVSGGGLRFTQQGGGASTTVGFYLGQGQSTSYINGASNLAIFDVDGAGLDAAIIWFV